MRRPTRPRRGPRVVALVAAVAAAVPTVASCGGPSPSSGTSSSPAGAAAGTTVDITLKDGTVSPRGTRVEVELGRPVTLRIDADAAGELHVHSTPEQEVEFPAGRSTRRVTIRQPGIVDVEDHALDQVVVQLQVS